MDYQKTTGRLLTKWRYQAKYSFVYKIIYIFNSCGERIKTEKWNNTKEIEYIDQIDFFLKHKTVGETIRYGNNVYLMNMEDTFNLRLYHEYGLVLIREGSD